LRPDGLGIIPTKFGHNACCGAAKQDAHPDSGGLASTNADPYKGEMKGGRSLKKRVAQAELVFERLSAVEPAPKGELEYVNPYTLLVAVVLSAQATDAGVNKATRALFKIADTPDKMVALGEEALSEKIKTIGLYRTKAKNVTALSRALIETYGGKVPRDREALESLPGVGRKTANVVLNTAFGEPTIAVDTHVFRVANRLGIAPGKTPREVEDELMRVVPARFLPHAHHWLILHGRYVCTARKPLCGSCALRDICPYEPKTAVTNR